MERYADRRKGNAYRGEVAKIKMHRSLNAVQIHNQNLIYSFFGPPYSGASFPPGV